MIAKQGKLLLDGALSLLVLMKLGRQSRDITLPKSHLTTNGNMNMPSTMKVMHQQRKIQFLMFISIIA